MLCNSWLSSSWPVCRRTVKPDEVYNLAAQSHVAVSFQCPEYTAQTAGVVSLHGGC